MPEKNNTKSRGLYTLRMRMDCLIMFAHPNGKVVPLVDTVPTATKPTTTSHQTFLSTSTMTHTAAHNETGPDDAHCVVWVVCFFINHI
jgi:hypothetical protein